MFRSHLPTAECQDQHRPLACAAEKDSSMQAAFVQGSSSLMEEMSNVVGAYEVGSGRINYIS